MQHLPLRNLVCCLCFETVASHMSQNCPLVGNTYGTSVRRNILLLLKRTHWKNSEKKLSNLLASPGNACTCLPSQPSPYCCSLVGRKRQTLQQWAMTLTASQRQNQGSQPRTAVANPTDLQRQKTCNRILPQAQLETEECRSILTEKDHKQGEMTSQSHLVQLFFV